MRGGLLVGEQFQNQLTHALLVFRVKLQKFHADRLGLNRTNHRRIHLDIRLARRAVQHELHKRPSCQRCRCLQGTAPIEISVTKPPAAGRSSISVAAKFAGRRRYSRRSNAWDVTRFPGLRA